MRSAVPAPCKGRRFKFTGRALVFSHKLRSAISRTRDQQRLPLKTFILLAWFCQIYSLRSYSAGRDVVRCMRARMGSAAVRWGLIAWRGREFR